MRTVFTASPSTGTERWQSLSARTVGGIVCSQPAVLAGQRLPRASTASGRRSACGAKAVFKSKPAWTSPAVPVCFASQATTSTGRPWSTKLPAKDKKNETPQSSLPKRKHEDNMATPYQRTTQFNDRTSMLTPCRSGKPFLNDKISATHGQYFTCLANRVEVDPRQS